jgi:predicted nuclease of predicted toxin-antitoxin system
VARRLCGQGVDACHVRDRGLLGSTDAEVLERAFEEDRILVTVNVADFEKLARARDLHAGIILIEKGDLTRDEQCDLLWKVVASLQEVPDLVNRVVRIAGNGELAVEQIPPA